MTITRDKAGALIKGRARIEGGIMAGKIEIRRHTIAGGKSVFIGDILTIGEDITAEDAHALVLMKKARLIEVGEKKKKQPEPEKSEPIEVQNRDAEVEKKTVKRGRKPKKKK